MADSMIATCRGVTENSRARRALLRAARVMCSAGNPRISSLRGGGR